MLSARLVSRGSRIFKLGPIQKFNLPIKQTTTNITLNVGSNFYFKHFSSMRDTKDVKVPEAPHFHDKIATEATPVISSHHTKKEDYVLFHPVYTKEELEDIQITHHEINGMSDRIAFALIRAVRFVFDTATGYTHPKEGENVSNMTEEQWLRRFIFLETIAGVPGMIGGMARHLRSLRTFRRDYGWIHTLLQEAENERSLVLISQGIFCNFYFFGYLLAPRTCHRFVGFLEEEATTYTRFINDLDKGALPKWKSQPAPLIAVKYWRLDKDATLRDVALVIRADEANHRLVNHAFADVEANDPSPFVHIPTMNEPEHPKTTAEKAEKEMNKS